jgi:AcrR family transcriptional regulator
MRTDKIIAAAAQLFARKGYHGTSTREIARLAEVSENTLFRHFDHKEDIFWSALRSRSAALQPRWDLLDEIRAGGTPDVVLPQILEVLTDTANYRPEVLRLIAVAFLELQGEAESLCRDVLSPLFSKISRYLAASIEKGEVVEVDPTMLAVSLMATALLHPQFSKLSNANSPFQLEERNVIHAYSKFWLNVLSPRLPVSSQPIVQMDGQSSN